MTTVLCTGRKDSRAAYYTCVKKPRVKTLSKDVLPERLHVGECALEKVD